MPQPIASPVTLDNAQSLSGTPKMAAQNVNFFYGSSQALFDVSLTFPERQVTALIGPSGCGKSTFLRCLNRMNDLIPGTRTEGLITLDKEDINAPNFDVVNLRRRVGMVFQKPTPFPKTIFENVAYGLRVNGERDESLIADKVEESLRRAAIFEEVKDRLHTSARSGSPAASSSACASPVPLPWNRKSCSWTNPPAPSTPSPRSASRKASTNSRASSASSSLPQYAAGRPRLRPHRLFLYGQVDRMRSDGKDFHQSLTEADRRLHHRALRVSRPLLNYAYAERIPPRRRLMAYQEHYTQQLLDNLRAKLLIMGSKTQQALDDAAIAVLNHDLPRAAAVLDGDTDIDDLENQIDEATLNILARTQPVARDLRFLMSVVRMVLDLERIGDESVVVAEQVTLSDKPIPSIVEKDLRALCTRTSAMLRNSLLAFQNGDAPSALAVSRYDDETAQMMVNIFQKLMQAVGDRTLEPWDSMHIVLITRALDRVCRRAENIAEHAYFMVEGVSLKHRRTLPQGWEK